MEPEFLDKRTAANLATWMANPNQLEHTNEGSPWAFDDFDRDRIYQIGNETQSTSSWNSLARSYIAFSCFQTAPEKDAVQEMVVPSPYADPKIQGNQQQTVNSVVTGVRHLPVRTVKTRSHGNQLEYDLPERTKLYEKMKENIASWKMNVNLPDKSKTFLDVAPLLRLKTLMTSIDLNCYKTDLTPTQYIRGATPHNHEIVIVPRRTADSYNVLAISFDEFNKHILGSTSNDSSLAHFKMSDIDVSWVAIPVGNRIIKSPNLVPYVASFLSNGLYAGTVNVLYDVTYTDPETEDFVCSAKQINVPAANSCSIPGPRNCLLVLGNVIPTLEMNGFAIPVWTPENKNVEVTNFADIWSKWFTTENLGTVLRQTNEAIVILVRRSVLNADDMANALAAEVYPAWRPGLGVQAEGCAPNCQYQFDKASCGGYGFSAKPAGRETVALAPGCPIQLQAITPLEMANAIWKERMEGFNFASTSANMQSPSGSVAARFIPSDQDKWGGVVWEEEEPKQVAAQYCVPVCSSIIRILINFDHRLDREYTFSNEHSYPAWNHLLASALSANTACFLITNDIPMKNWSGFGDPDDFHMTDLLVAVKHALYGELIIHNSAQEMKKTWARQCQPSISRYYRIDPFNSLDWAVNCPVSISFTLQWNDKLALAARGEMPSFRYFKHANEIFRAIPVPEGMGFAKIHLSATINVQENVPRVFMLTCPTSHVYAIWLDVFSHLSSKDGSRTGSGHQVMTTTPTYKSKQFDRVDEDRLYILNSLLDSVDNVRFMFSVSPMMNPKILAHPKDGKAAENHIVDPIVEVIEDYRRILSGTHE